MSEQVHSVPRTIRTGYKLSAVSMGKWVLIQSLGKLRVVYKLSAVSMRKWKLIPSLRKLRMAWKLSTVSMRKWKLIPSLRKLRLILMDLAKRRCSRSQIRFCPVLAATV
jgi:hypothetical protein